MLTLDTEQLARQRRQTEALTQKHRMQELIRAEAQNKEVTVAMDGDICTTSLEQQLGNPLSTTELLRRVKLMNPDLIFEQSIRFPDRVGIYVQEKRPHVLKLDAAMDKRMIVAMQMGVMPERTVRHVKKTKVPSADNAGWQEVEEFAGQTRGWRMVLLRLLQERLITPSQIDRYFPPNLNSKAWQRFTT